MFRLVAGMQVKKGLKYAVFITLFLEAFCAAY